MLNPLAFPPLHGETRRAEAGELAALYRVLADGGALPDPAVPTVVLVGIDVAGRALAATLAHRLSAFGVRVVGVRVGLAPDSPDLPVASPGRADLPVVGVGIDDLAAWPAAMIRGDGAAALRATYFLGGAAHGWCVAGVVDEERHADALAEFCGDRRLRAFASALRPAPVLSRVHKPGSDSTGVVQFAVDGREVVAKIGSRDVLGPEVAFTGGVNATLAAHGVGPLFPELYAVHVDGEQVASLMEAATPLALDDVFGDVARTQVRADALAALEPYFAVLAEWYRLTMRPVRPTVVDYLYRERFSALLDVPAFVSTFRAFFPDADLMSLLEAPVRLPGGLVVPGYAEAARWLDKVAPAILPDWGSGVHGDIYVTNMLRRDDGSPALIDPRTVWDGRDRPDVGFGDPVFDLSTLLHGLLPMAAILDAAARDAIADVLPARPDVTATPLDLSSLTLPTAFSPELRRVEERLLRVSPADEPASIARTRLYIGAAASLAGWLKYERSLRSGGAWLATYAYTVWYLWRARAVQEQETNP